ncbi:MAG: 4-hydroxybenzoate octaprenyltransferase [Leptospiraceae bacterium]|nr:MAG: 4-hydroxybenzoate octaprenyltransferase [Leptospiraceae bacterium]
MKDSNKSLLEIIESYLRMIKFSHSIFALPFAGIAVIEVLYKYYFKHSVLNWTKEELIIKVIGIIICMVSMRSAAMGFNRIVDREFDAKNPRTSQREIPAGKISLSNAKLFVVIFTIIFIISAFIINPLAGYLSPIVVLVTFGYSYTKRITFLCHFILGFAIGIAPIAVWVALLNKIEIVSLFLGASLMFYIAGFDILYACQDIEFDKKTNLYSIPAKFGIKKAMWIARISHFISLIFLIFFSYYSKLNIIFYITVFMVGILFFIEHYLVRGGRIENIPIAFFHINSIISTILFFGLLLDRIIFT